MTGHAAKRNTFDRIVLAAIIANLIVTLTGFVDHSHEEQLETLDIMLLWFFAAELVVRLWIARLGFFRDHWNTFDAFIIVVALLPVILPDQFIVAGGGIAVLRVVRLARVLHHMRHVSHLRLFRVFVRWNNKPRSKLSMRIIGGKIRPVCFFCNEEMALKEARAVPWGWVYGPCCHDQQKVWRVSTTTE